MTGATQQTDVAPVADGPTLDAATADKLNGGDPLNAALAYTVALGWPVLPLHAVAAVSVGGGHVCSCPRGEDCPRPGEHPLSATGVRDARLDPRRAGVPFAEARKDGDRPVNLGLACVGFVVVSVEDEAGAGALERWSGDEPLPETATASCGDRVDHYFAVPGRPGGRTLADGLRVYAFGDTVAAPPSGLPTGQLVWRPGPVAPAPSWLLEALPSGPPEDQVTSLPLRDEFAAREAQDIGDKFAVAVRRLGRANPDKIAPALERACAVARPHIGVPPLRYRDDVAARLEAAATAAGMRVKDARRVIAAGLRGDGYGGP